MAGKGKNGAGDSPEKVIRENRQEVANTLHPPYSAVCALDILWPNKSYTLGTGYICAERVLVTVGHNLYDPSRGGRPSKVGILPAVTCGTAPFGAIIVEHDDLRIYSEWMYGGEDRHDLGAIVLPEPLGRRTGWSTLGVAPELGRGDQVVVTGFPADNVHRWQELRMMRSVGAVVQPIGSLVSYDADATGGQSGAPIWLASDQYPNMTVIGFHKGELVGDPLNLFVLIDQDHLAWIRQVMTVLDSGIPIRTREAAEAAPAPAIQAASGEGPPAEAGPLPPLPTLGGDTIQAARAGAERLRASRKAAKVAERDEGVRKEDFRVPAKGRFAIDLPLRAGDTVKGRIRIALPAGTFTDCDLVLQDTKGHPVDHLPMFVSSSGATDFHSERFSLAAATDGPHHLVFRELNGVSAAIVQLEFKTQ